MDELELDLVEEYEEFLLEDSVLLGDGEAIYTMGARGCSDRDNPVKGELALSPMHKIRTVQGALNVAIPLAAAVGPDGSKKLLLMHSIPICELARSVFRMDMRPKSSATVFVSSPSTVISAVRCMKTDGGQMVYSWRAGQEYPCDLSLFLLPEFKRVHLEPLSQARLEADDAELDAGFWKVTTDQDRFWDVERPQLFTDLREFDFLLPCSLQAELAARPELRENAECIMINFPEISSLMNRLESNDSDIKRGAFRDYSFLVSDLVNEDIAAKALELGMSIGELKNSLTNGSTIGWWEDSKLSYQNKIRSCIKTAFRGFSDGDCICSFGRVLQYDNETVSTSISALHGSSGAPMVLLPLAKFKVFFAVFSGTANKNDCNVGTSCDDPAFVAKYIRFVLNDIPLPSSSYWDGAVERVRLALFKRWLAVHVSELESARDEVSSCLAWISSLQARRRD